MQTHTHELTFTTTEVVKRYVTWDRGEADREWACLRVLAEHAPGVAPRPIRRDEEGGRPVMVMERLPGEPLGGDPLTVTATASLGKALQSVYAVPVEAVRAAGIGERAYGPAGHAELLAGWLSDSYDLAQCQDPGLVAEAVESALGFLRADGLPEPRQSALGIADLNPANVLWDGQTCRLVDFEDAGLSDPAYELADHVEHLAGRLPPVYDPKALVDAVGLDESDQDRMRAYRPLWAAFWLAMLLPGNGGFRRNPPGTTEAQARHLLSLLE